MNNQNPNFSKIEDYLLGKLSTEEKNQFETEMTQNQALHKEVKLQQLEHRTMELLVEKDLKADLNQWKKEKQAAKSSTAKVIPINKTRRLFVRLAAAASVLLVIGFLGQNFLGTNINNDSLAQNYFGETAISDRASNGQSSNFPEVLLPSIRAMQSENYEEAITLLSTVNIPIHQQTAQILQAECHFQIKQYQQTIDLCTELINKSTDDGITEKAEWYMLLSNLALGNEETTNKLLQNILVNKNHSFYPYAKKLHSDMNSFWSQFKF